MNHHLYLKRVLFCILLISMQLTVLSQVQTRQIKQAETSLMEKKERDKVLPKSKESTTLQTLKENQLQSQTKQIQRKERPKAEIVSNPISDNTSPFEAVKGLKEDSDKRDLYSKHYINPDGSYTAIIGAGPIHYEKNGQFLDIDHTIKSNADFNYPYANIHNIFESYFGANSHTGIKNKTAEGEVHEFLNTRMYWERNGQAINTITSNNQTIRIEGDKAYYDNIYGSISAEFTMLTGKRKLNYIIPNKEALGNLPNDADYLVFTEDVILPFGWTSTTTEKGILIKDNFGKEIYLYENPLSTDEVQKFSRESNTLFETFQIGNTLTIKTKVKTDWLLSNERVYPVKVDPTVNVAVNNSQWHTGYQNWNTWTGNIVHSNNQISVGRGDDINIFNIFFPRYFDGFMQFSLPTLPAASYVTSANLHLTKTGGNQNNFGSVYIRQISYDLPLSSNSGNIMNTAQYFFSDDISGSIGGVNGDKVAAFNDEGIEFLTLESGNTIQLALWGQGNGNSSTNVQFAGYSSVNRPYLVINYELPILLNCGDLFTDTGGTSGNYSNNENIVWTIHPDDPVNERVSVNFLYAYIEGNFDDVLEVYDGPDISSPELPSLTGYYDFLISYVSSHPTGALTFRFKSDFSVNYAGWEATIDCVPKTDLVGDCAEGNLSNPNGPESGYNIVGTNRASADYLVPIGQTFVLEQVILNIWGIIPPDEITLSVYSDNGLGTPSGIFNTQTITPSSAYVAGASGTNNLWRIVLDLEPIMLSGSATEEKRYWISPSITSDRPYLWEYSSTTNHYTARTSTNSGNNWSVATKENVYSFNGKCYRYVYWDDTLTWTPNNPDGTNGTASTENDNILVIEGNNASFSQHVTARHLTVNQDGKLDIWKNLSLTGDLDNHGSITFKSNASTTGQLDEFYGRLTGNGSFTTEKFFPARRAFRFVSSPISTIDGPKPFIRDNWQEGVNNPNNSTFLNPNPGYGIHITGSQTGQNGFDSTPTGNPSLFGYNNLTQEWFNVPNTNATNLEAGIPWRIMIRGDRSINVTLNASVPTNTVIRTTGKIKTGDVERNDLSTTPGDLNFIGNPYQAAIDMGEVLVASDNLNPAYYYVWDPMLGGNPTVGQPGGRGAYVTVNLPNGTNSSGSTANQFLQPGQAAFVYTLNNGPANLKIQESHKNLNGLTAGRIAFQDESFINLVLYNSQAFESGYTPSDGLLINFSDEGDNDITFKDAPKLTNLDENLSSRIGEQFFSLQDRAYPTSDEVIPLNLTQYRYNAYVFEVNTLNLPESTTAFLVDKYLNKTTELSADQITHYSFEVNNDDELSIAPDRFELIFKVEEVNLNLIELTHQEIRLYPNPTMTHSFYIEADSYKNKKLDVFISNMLGQTILHKSFLVPTTGRVEVILPNATTKGIYNVNVTSENKKLISKKLIKN